MFVPHAVEALLNSYHTQHFSVSCPISYEVILLTAFHVSLLCCNNFNPASLFPFNTSEVPDNCLTWIDHLLTHCDDLQEIILGNTDFSWFTDGSYLKGNNDKYCGGHAIATPSDVVEAACILMTTSVQQAELYVLTWA